MSKDIEQLNKHLVTYLAELRDLRTRIGKLEGERAKLRKDVNRLRLQVKKAKEDKQGCLDEIGKLKQQLKEVETG